MTFPIDLGQFKRMTLDPAKPTLTDSQLGDLRHNIALCRDAIVLFTAVADAKGLGGHTGGPYDIVPEVLIVDALIRSGAPIYPAFFDEAGHRVAIQYLMAALHGDLPYDQLLHYREADMKLPGHPELGLTPGVKFSSGRLGHMWPMCNGIALAHPDKAIVMFGSDGSQMEGNDAEAARFAVAGKLNINLLLDDNDVTIAGHPSDYLPGYDLAQTLKGHGLQVNSGNGEDLGALYTRICAAINDTGPVALVNKRSMAPGIEGLEGDAAGHDVIKVNTAIDYLTKRDHAEAAAMLRDIVKPERPGGFLGSSTDMQSNRNLFGEALCDAIDTIAQSERARRVVVIDADLEGSTGIKTVRQKHPEVYISSGVMERGNMSAAAGFGFEGDRQGVFATFSAFLEMVISEITMARLNNCNLLCHFSHAGVDDMADNTCHFGVNNFFAHNGLEEHDTTRLYFPADGEQMRAVVARVFNDKGLRFVFSTRSKVPSILDEDGEPMFAGDYTFEPGKDELIRKGSAGYVVSFGDILYRALDAVDRARENGLDVGLINKPTLNVVDEDMMQVLGKSPFVLVAESLNKQTGLGSRMGTWLLERGYSPKYRHIGTYRDGCGGLWQQVPHQGIDSLGISDAIAALAG